MSGIRLLLSTAVTAVLVLATAGSPPAVSAGTTVALVGDAACATTDRAYAGGQGRGEACRQRSVSDLVVPSRISRLIALGDLQYESGAYDQFVRSYGPSYGRVRSKTLPVCGNHEYETPGAAGYVRYFGRSCRWYTTTVGTAQFVMLDTNQPLGVGSPQYAFVRDTLTATRARCVFLVGHHPRYSAGKHGDDAALDPIWDLGVARGVTAMFSGHDHAAMRYRPRDAAGAVTSAAAGMTQVVSGGGGRNVTAQATRPAGLARYLPKLGVYEMEIGHASVTLRFRSRWGNVLDRTTLHCRHRV
jgi:acid phosphatase type 7